MTTTSSLETPAGSPREQPTAHPVGTGRSTAGSIVVGHDGSAGADAALEVALGLGRDLPAPVVIVRTWSIDTAPHGSVFHDGYAASFSEIGETVRTVLREETADRTLGYPDVDIEVRGVLGRPAEVLIDLSADARMLVVGSRGLGGVAGMLLGSVSDRCTRHARCPVLVVPRTRGPRA
ncbi:nucleotide-binding universal stress UspA family protein [Clavibacter michiganensis]|uniref:universal stress protein n=1 Tax=Clavibacter michiganensis TaxID=28447 RepID=UPI001AE5FB51|nr:universal stress protein [Clavibacter michiganensis]MBP2459081.1 nucleotide-binding universal stress UspA family protein [Clavibacter michiganensis]MDQ0411653.1 nucleotide-binding universal stress UspA family protein [Clavibacter michiganensis]